MKVARFLAQKGLLAVVFGLFPVLLFSQTETQNVRAAWLQLHQRTVLPSGKWASLSDFQFRWHTAPAENFHMMILRTRLLRTLKKGWNAGFGYAFSLAEQNSPTAEPRLAVPEHRPFWEANFSDNWGPRWLFSQRFVVENRFFRKTENGALIDGWRAGQGRTRVRAQVDYSFLKKPRLELRLRVSNEAMVNLWRRPGLNVFDQNRLGAGLVFLTEKGLGTEIGWTNWWQQLGSGDQFLNRNLARVAISHNLVLKKRGS